MTEHDNSTLFFTASPPPLEPNDDSSNDEETPDSDSDSSWLDTPLFSPESADMMASQNNSFFFGRWQRSPALHPVVPRSTSQRPDCSVRLTSAWDSIVSKNKFYILIVTLCVLWPLGAISYREFSHSTDSTFHPIPGTPSARAQEAFADRYKDDWSNPLHPIFLVAMESKNRSCSLINKTSPAYRMARNFSMGLAHTLNTTCWDGLACPSNETWIRVSSFYSFEDLEMPTLAKGFATPNGKTSLIQVQYLLPSNEQTDPKARVRELQDKIKEYRSSYSYSNNDMMTVSYTGLKYFQSDLMASI